MPNPILNRRVVTHSGGYPAYIQQLFSRWTVNVPAAYKVAMATFIAQCKADGNWDEIDAMWMPAQYDETNALQQLKSSSYTLTRVNSPEWLSGAGWKGDGASVYLRTGFILSSNAVKYQLHNSSIGAYSNTNSAINGVDFGAQSGLNSYTELWGKYSDGKSYTLLNDVNESGGTGAPTNATSVGFNGGKRTSNTNIDFYYRGTNVASITNTEGAGLPTVEMYMLANNQANSAIQYSNRRICFSFIGSNSVNFALLNTAVKNYLKTIWLLDSDVAAWYNELTTKPSIETIGLYYEMVVSSKNSGNYTEHDRIWIRGAEYQDNALVSLKNPTSTHSSEINAPTWTQWQGYTGAATKALNWNYTPSIDAVKFLQDGGCIWWYSRIDDAGLLYDIGASDASNMNLVGGVSRTAGGNFLGYINEDGLGAGTSNAVANSLGLFSIVRTAAGVTELWKNGVKIKTGSTASTGLTAKKIYELAVNINGVLTLPTTRQIFASGIGSANIDQAELYNEINGLATNFGVNV